MAYESTLRSLRVKSGKLGNVKTQFTNTLAGTFAEFNFPFIVETATEQASTLAKVYDLSATEYQDLATSGTGAGYTANYQLFPDTEAIGDYALFGAAAPFGVIRIDVSATTATYGADSITWQYWNGSAWSTLTVVWDDTNTTPAAGGKRPFMQDGQIIFSAPSDWELSTIDSQSAYWIRAYVNAASITQIPLLDSHEHYIITCTTGCEVPADGELVRARISFVTPSAANADSKFILTNLTDGTCSAIQTLTKNISTSQEIADLGMTVSAGDVIAVYGTDEDGTTEYADGTMQIDLLRK